MALLAQQGLHGISIRSIAGVLGLVPNALYRYYTNREALESALAAEVAARLHVVLAAACEGKKAEESIRSLASAYMQFAKEHQLLYEALLVPRPATGDDAVAPEQLWRFVVGEVRRVSGERRKQEAAVSLWAVLHGMAALQSAGAFNPEKPRSSLGFALTAWMKGASAARREEMQARSGGARQRG